MIEQQQQQQKLAEAKQVAEQSREASDESRAANEHRAGLYSDQQNIDLECEKLLRNTKKQVKRMMEEAVTKKFIHEESSSIISLCVAVEHCLSHGLKRRALGLFKTSSSTALIQKVAKTCPEADQVLRMVEQEERNLQSEQQHRLARKLSANNQQDNSRSPLKLALSSSSVHKRHLWIKFALIDKKLVAIVEYLADNWSKFYDSDALMSSYLCAQILASLLVGPSALEFSRSKTNDYYTYEEPTADELLERHKLSNPVACLCSSPRSALQQSSNLLCRSATDSSAHKAHNFDSHSAPRLMTSQNRSFNTFLHEESAKRLNGSQHNQRRRPLGLKTNLRRCTLVTDCHHNSCQDASEHHQIRGYSILCSSSDGPLASTPPAPSMVSTNASLSIATSPNRASELMQQTSPNCSTHQQDWPLWSPRMLHETLHQNSSSALLFAKNNVMLETQPNQSMAGYLSLHQTSSDLILKWIPNQMINGSRRKHCCSSCSNSCLHAASESEDESQQDSNSVAGQPQPVESSYLELVVVLSMSRIVLLHCQFSKSRNSASDLNDAAEQSVEEKLILVELDGVQRAPFRFPKGGLRLFLGCLESGLRPTRFLDPAIRFDDASMDPLESPPMSATLNGYSENLHLSTSTDDSTGVTNKLDSLLRRLLSIKRLKESSNEQQQQQQSNASSSPTPNEQTRTDSPDGSDDCLTVSAAFNPLPTYNYVFRIVLADQVDMQQSESPSSASTGRPVSASKSNQPASSAERQTMRKFRWSFSSRFARFSNRSTASSSSSSVSGFPSPHSNTSATANNPLSRSDQLTVESSSMDMIDDNNNNRSLETVDSSAELARIEAKLNDLKESTSDHFLAHRMQSIQTLCDSMRRQIVARAFYGWLVHCRKAKIIRLHLAKLIKSENDIRLVEDPEMLDKLSQGLNWQRWEALMSQREALHEDELRLRVNRMVYYGGIEEDALRKQVWPYLLDLYKFSDCEKEKAAKYEAARESYQSCGREWIKIERVVKQRDSEILAANMARARNKLMASEQQQSNHDQEKLTTEPTNAETLESLDESNSETVDQMEETEEKENHNNNTTTTTCNNRFAKNRSSNRQRRRARLESTGSVGSDASITDQFGNNIHRIDKDVQRCDRNFWYFKQSQNLEKLRNVMCTYVWQHLDVGYVQGMCDLAAPFLVIFDDEVVAFSCFSQLMERMVANFPHGSAMDQHFESLKHLMQVLDPKLFEVLQSNGDYTHFYFCYRWLLLDFKRELSYADLFGVWETIWSARRVVSDHFVVFMALAMVRYYRDIIIENNMDFTDTIKFFNEMAERHDAKRITSLARDCILDLQRLMRL